VTKPKCTMNGIKYNVPTILKIEGKKKIFFKVPKLKAGQVLIFSPYLIHGFGYNFSKKKTRSALEFRPIVS
jgi:ectoine hydroxylase-related dioxygenase (phytanoyl-CoA dioxygenase family)